MGREVVLVLRLVFDRRMDLRYGELLDAESVRQGRFVGLPDLADAVQQWMDRQRRSRPVSTDPST